jgi:hypothetical protein
MTVLTAKDIAERQNVKKRVAQGWIQRGLFPNAHKKYIEPFGEIWLVPETDLEGFQNPRPGPKKQTDNKNENNSNC